MAFSETSDILKEFGTYHGTWNNVENFIKFLVTLRFFEQKLVHVDVIINLKLNKLYKFYQKEVGIKRNMKNEK